MTEFELLWKRLRDYAAQGKPRSSEWLNRIRLLPCVVCQGEAKEAHHILPAYTGMKTSDIFTIPVCRTHHEYFHQHETEAEYRAVMLEQWIRIAHRYILEEMR